MRYAGMPMGMWMLFQRSFRNRLIRDLGYDADTADGITAKAFQRYRTIIRKLPEFEKKDRFLMNIVSCAMLTAFVLSMPKRPEVGELTEYYRSAMMTEPMKLFCRLSGKNKFTDADQKSMQKTAAFRAGDRNPYSWNMEYLPYPDNRGYEARFTQCGICTLMKEYGLSDLIPAMCRLDYTMSEAGGASRFVREHTLAEGGPYCDCGYYRK